MFRLTDYHRLCDLAKADIRCGETGDCIGEEGKTEPCPFIQYGYQCSDMLLQELGEVARIIYDDKRAMEALKSVAANR